MPQHLSLIAGNGDFPAMFLRSAAEKGVVVSVVALRGEADPALAKLAPRLCWVEIGQLQALVDALLSFPGRSVALAGGIKKVRFFLPSATDARALGAMARLLTKKDDSLLRVLARELESDGLSVVPSTLYLEEAMAPKGTLGKRAPTPAEAQDLAFGLALARHIGAADVGQTVVVKDKMPLAVEAIEGTDACILRGGKLGRAGAVVVKALKPGQDVRFDLPAVGPRTIKIMRKAKANALGLEAGQVIMINRKETLALADRYGIAVVGVTGADVDSGAPGDSHA